MVRDCYDSAGRQLHALFRAGVVGQLTDGELLDRFAGQSGEAAELAFAALVERHGPMVFRTCRQALGDVHAAEDAFQATFLVLARRGRSFRVRGSLAAWLHEVARRTASRLRAASARRVRYERKATPPAEAVVEQPEADDLGPVLHEELGRLSARYRVPLVLCYLEGLTAEQAARELGWPAGTVRSRLARGRERLRARLIRRGLAPSAAMLTAALVPRSAWAAVPARLADAAVRTAALAAARGLSAGAVPTSILTLTEGVLIDMAITKLKAAGLYVLVAAALASGALVSAQGTSAQPSEKAQVRSESERLTAVEAKLDRLLREIEPRAAAPGEHVRPAQGAESENNPAVAAPTSNEQPRPAPAASTSNGRPRLPSAGSTSNVAPNSAETAPTSNGPPRPAGAAPTSNGPPRPASAAPTSNGPPRPASSGSTSNAVLSQVPASPGVQIAHPALTSLEQRVAELERRLAQIERQIAGSPVPSSQPTVPGPDAKSPDHPASSGPSR